MSVWEPPSEYGVGCGAHRAAGCGHYVMGLAVVRIVQLAAVAITELPAKPEPRVRVVTGELNATLLGPYFEKSCESDSCRPPSRFEAELWQGMWPQPSAVSSPCLNDVPQAPQKAFRGERAHVNAGWACEEIIKHPLPVGSSITTTNRRTGLGQNVSFDALSTRATVAVKTVAPLSQ
eukprot:scaffold82844_cov16-Tisochrysis_lutea.AAC.1